MKSLDSFLPFGLDFFCLPVCSLKANALKNAELLFCVFLCVSVKIGLCIKGDLGCTRIGY
jgi:hypothetical protein